MAWESPIQNLGQFTASSDYNDAADQFVCVRLTTAGALVKSTVATQWVIGVLQDRPSSGFAANIMTQGVTKVRVTSTSHSAIVYGNKLSPSTDGAVVPSTLLTRYVIGRALENLAANTTGIITMFITHEGAGSSAAASGA